MRSTNSILILLLFFFLMQAGLPLQSHSAEENEEKRVSLDFKDVDIQVFIKFISDLTGKNFIVGNKVQGKITVISPEKVTVDEAYAAFESVLEVQGYTTVPSGNVTKIVRAVEARKKNVALQTERGGAARPKDRIVTQVIPLEHASSQQLRKVLTPLVSKQGHLVGYQPTDTLILTDYESNVQKVLDIVSQVDRKSLQVRLEVYELEHAEAAQVAKSLNNIMKARQQAQGKGSAPFVFAVPNERINSVILLAEKGTVQQMDQLIAKLDQPTPKGKAQIHVVRLDNAVAADLAKVLSGLSTSEGKKEKPLISENVQVAADKASNSLAITAKQEEFEALKSVIDRLDQRRAQVYVEAAIMEVSMDTSLDVGIDWQGAAELGSEGFGVGTVGGTVGRNVEDVAGGGTGASLGILSFPFTFGGNTYYSLSAFLQASQTDNRVNIISTPQLLTMENEEAKVVVAENRPFITSREIAENDREFSNIEYKDVGVTLKVTPQINEQDLVKMDVYQEVSRVEQRALDAIGAKTPVTSKRTAETRVEVRDGQTAVIAGLIQEKSTRSEKGVPGLSQIPLLGWLFKQQGDTQSKKNLMVFLTPQVVRTDQQMERVWAEKRKRMSRLSYGIEGKVQSINAPFQVFDPVPALSGDGQ